MPAEFHLLQPWWLLLLPFAVGWWLWQRRHPLCWPALRSPVTIRLPSLAHYSPTKSAGGNAARSSLPAFLLLLGMVLSIVALAQPVSNTAVVQDSPHSEPVDLVLLVGTAVTMNLRDYRVDGERVSRMTMVRQLLDRFVSEFLGQRIGLVILGDPPAIWLPLTADKGVVRNAVSRIRTTLGGRLSDTGGALQLIAEEFAGADNKVVVMVTDAGLQLGTHPPAEGAASLAEKNMKLYTIAMGSSDPDAGEKDGGHLIYEPVNLALMQQLADIGNGRMFHVQDASGMEQALATIEAENRQPAKPAATYQLVAPLYPGFVFLALTCFLGAMVAAQKGVAS
jgi:Ca-activated chloride channel family protein